MPLRTNRKGFSTSLLLILAFVMFLIAGSYAVHIQSENDQMVNTARAAVSGARLNFISQTMQADFYNNFLQNKFESILAQFIVSKEHQIDPQQQDFMSSNMKSELENYFSEVSSSIVEGEAAQVYAAAYSTIPDIACEPMEMQGASSGVTLTANNGTLIANALSLGQQIYCRDTEEESDSLIALRAKDYQLKSRIIQMYDKARSAVGQSVALLEWTTGTYQWGGNTWRLPDDAQSKTYVWQDWKGTLMGLVIPIEATDGIKAEGVHATAEQTNLVSDCYGEVKAANGARTPAQTCRPEGLQIMIGKDVQDMGGIPLSFKEESNTLKITVEYNGVAVSFSSKLLGDLIGDLVSQVYTSGMTKGYVVYGTTTRLCNSFKGRTSQVVISGSIVETNADYTPSGFNNLTMEFTTNPQSLDTSDIPNTKNCDGKNDSIKTNVFDLLTLGGNKTFQFNITSDGANGKVGVKQEDVTKLAQTVASNPMYTTTGEVKNVTLIANINGNTTTGTATPPAGTGANSALPAITGTGGGGTVAGLQNAMNTATNIYTPMRAVTQVLDTAVSELTSLSRVEDAEAVASASTALCKFMGMNNQMETDNTYNALLAICSIARLSKDNRANTVCNLAGLYQAVKSGSAQAALAAIAAMLNGANYLDAMVTINQIETAMKTGNVEDVLMAASSALRLTGKADAANYLAGASQLVYAVKTGDVKLIAMGLISMLGDSNKMAYIYNSLLSLDEAIKSGDARAVLQAAGAVAQGFGFSGLAQAGSILTQGEVLVHMVTNFDEVLAACKGKVPWDLICSVPVVSGGVCEDKWGSCIFSYGLPTFQVDLLCNDLVFDLGFQIDCTCIYACPGISLPVPLAKSVGVNLTAIAMLLNPEQYAGRLGSNDVQAALATGGLMNFCRLDP